MMMWTNENFLKMIERDYPDVDWDNIPPIDSKPTHWEIDGLEHRRLVFPDGKEIKDKVGFSISKEYPTKEEAEAKLESMKNDPSWCEENLNEDHYTDLSTEYYGPVDFDSVKIIEMVDDELMWLHVYKGWLDEIKSGKKVFPMALP